VFLFEWSLFNLTSDDASLAMKPVATTEAKSLIPISLNLTKKIYIDVAKSPLFIEGRKPVEKTLIPTLTPSQKKQANKPFKLTLSGLSLFGNHSLALLQDTRGKYHRLHIGEELEGWILKTIQQSSVTLYSSGQMKTIELKKFKQADNAKIPPTPSPKGGRGLRTKKLPLHRGHK